jgi:hypothetical protein
MITPAPDENQRLDRLVQRLLTGALVTLALSLVAIAVGLA